MKVLYGAADFIHWLNSSRVKWGIVTNGNHIQHQKAQVTGLDEKAPFLLASMSMGANKPAPQVFMEAIRLLDIEGVLTRELLFVGDNPYTASLARPV